MTVVVEALGIVGDVAVTAGAIFIAVTAGRLGRIEKRATAHGRALRALVTERIQRHPDSAMADILRDEQL